MTPFGAKLRDMRKARGFKLAEFAAAIGVSTAYLSALELGQRGQPNWQLVQRMIVKLNIIWDEAEELVRLAEISHPKVVLDTSGLSPQATELSNLLASKIRLMSEEEIAEMLYLLKVKRR
jgi:transcriptional regulator with XRE-family HTH domain